MRFITYQINEGVSSPGLLELDYVIPLDETGKQRDIMEYVRAGRSGIEDARQIADQYPIFKRIPLSKVKLLSPILKPTNNVFCVGRNYQEHIEEGDKVYGANSGFAGVPPAPIFFTKPATSIIGPDADVLLHKITKRLDYEIELGVVIGKGGINITESDALAHVWGYTIINDITARDLQDHHKQWFKGKGLNTFCPIGPWVVPYDEILDPHGLAIHLTVNGETRQKANTSQMIFDIRRIISELSAAQTLEPGDVIATGTCSGCAFGMEPPAWLANGDSIEASIEGIGTLRNTVREV